MKRTVLVILVLVVIFVACKKESLPYKFVSDTKPAGIKQVPRPVTSPAQTVSPTSAVSKPDISWDCKDSDYGDNLDAKGVVTGRRSDGTTFSFEDECFGGILLENNCVDGKPESTKVRCERGCQNGFCV